MFNVELREFEDGVIVEDSEIEHRELNGVGLFNKIKRVKLRRSSFE
jgi:hypothetical protein